MKQPIEAAERTRVSAAFFIGGELHHQDGGMEIGRSLSHFWPA